MKIERALYKIPVWDMNHLFLIFDAKNTPECVKLEIWIILQ